MRKIIYYGVCLLAGLLAGCNGDDGLHGEGDGTLYPVSFELADLMQATRATGSETPTGLAAGTGLTIVAYNPNNQAFVAMRQYKVNASADGLELEDGNDPMYLPVGTYDFCAMTPLQTSLSAGNLYGTVPENTDALGSVTQEQMGAEKTNITLGNLKHVASQIQFTVQVVKQKVSAIQSFTVQSIDVSGMVAAATDNYYLPENRLLMPDIDETGKYKTLTIGGEGVDDVFTAGEAGDGSVAGFVNKQKNPLIVFPKKESSFDAVVKVNIQAAGETGPALKDLKVKVNRLAFEPGKLYLFEVNYGWDYVRFSISVADWVPVELTDGVGGGEQAVKNKVTIAEWTETIDNNMTI